MARHPKKKAKAERFAAIPLRVLYHPAVTTLPHPAFRVLMLLSAAYTGFNNGALGVTAKQAAAAGIGSNHTLYKSLRELSKRGVIVVTYPASRTPPRPTMHAITWRPLDDTKYTQATTTAAHDYRNWAPEKRKGRCTPCTQGCAQSALMENASG